MTDPDAAGGSRAGGGARPSAQLGRLARGGALNLTGAATAAVLSLGFVVLVTHLAPREDFGVFMAATSVFLVAAAVGKLGANTGVVYFVARLRALGDERRLGQFLRAALRPVVALSLALAAAIAVLAPQLAALVLADPGPGVVPLRVLAAFLPLAVLSDVCLAATRGFGIVRAFVLVEKVGRPFGQFLLLGLAFLAGWKGAAALTWAWALPYLPAAVIAMVWARRARRRVERVAEKERSPATSSGSPGQLASPSAEFWRFTAPRALSSVIQVVLQRLDIILLAALRGPVEAAVYGAVTRVLVVGQLGGQALAVTVQPALSALLAHDNRPEVKQVFQASTGWLVLSTWPLFLLLAVFHAQVPAVFGDGYGTGAPVVLILALTMLVSTGVGMVDVLLSMAGRTRWVLGNSLAGLAVNVVLNLVLIPRYGVVGAAIAWAGAIAVNNLAPLAQVGAALRMHPFGRGFRTAVVLSAGCFGGLPLLARAAFGDDLVVVFASIAVALLGYVPGLWLLRRPLALQELRSTARTRRGSAPSGAGEGAG